MRLTHHNTIAYTLEPIQIINGTPLRFIQPSYSSKQVDDLQKEIINLKKQNEIFHNDLTNIKQETQISAINTKIECAALFATQLCADNSTNRLIKFLENMNVNNVPTTTILRNPCFESSSKKKSYLKEEEEDINNISISQINNFNTIIPRPITNVNKFEIFTEHSIEINSKVYREEKINKSNLFTNGVINNNTNFSIFGNNNLQPEKHNQDLIVKETEISAIQIKTEFEVCRHSLNSYKTENDKEIKRKENEEEIEIDSDFMPSFLEEIKTKNKKKNPPRKKTTTKKISKEDSENDQSNIIQSVIDEEEETKNEENDKIDVEFINNYKPDNKKDKPKAKKTKEKKTKKKNKQEESESDQDNTLAIAREEVEETKNEEEDKSEDDFENLINAKTKTKKTKEKKAKKGKKK